MSNSMADPMIKEAPEMTDTVVEHALAEQLVQALSSTATDEQLIAMLVDRARTEGRQLTGEGWAASAADEAAAEVRSGGRDAVR